MAAMNARNDPPAITGANASEATLAVLATHEPPTADELSYAVMAEVCCDAAARAHTLCDGLARRLQR
jgi:hypothetical protein